jgi:hypothetical protein
MQLDEHSPRYFSPRSLEITKRSEGTATFAPWSSLEEQKKLFLPASDTCPLLTLYRMLSFPRGRVAEALSWRWQPPHHVYDLPATTGEPLSMPCRHISSKQRGKPWFFADIRTCGPHLAPSATKGTTVMNMASSCSRRSSNACIRGTIQLDRAHASCWSSLRPQCMSVWVFHRTCAMFR